MSSMSFSKKVNLLREAYRKNPRAGLLMVKMMRREAERNAQSPSLFEERLDALEADWESALPLVKKGVEIQSQADAAMRRLFN